VRKKIVIEAINPLHGNVNYLKELRELAKNNRKKPTTGEEIIWKEILMKRKIGYKFLRQKPVNRFILDFYCSELNLAIEIDGNSHNKKKNYDNARDLFLNQIGIKTIRFSNDEVIDNIENVKKKIMIIISPPCQGRG